MRKPSNFKLRDVTRAIKAVNAGGAKVSRVQIAKDGGVVLILETALSDGTADDSRG